MNSVMNDCFERKRKHKTTTKTRYEKRENCS